MSILDRILRLDLRIDNNGAKFVSRSENVKDALTNRLATYRRSVPWRPNYGSVLKKYINEPINSDLRQQITKEIETVVGAEPRIKNLRKVTYENDGAKLNIFIECDIVGEEDLRKFKVVL